MHVMVRFCCGKEVFVAVDARIYENATVVTIAGQRPMKTEMCQEK